MGTDSDLRSVGVRTRMLVRSAPFGKDPADGTRFSQFLFVGLNYSFGLVLNNVVNPRFGGGDGGGGFFFSQ